MAQPKEVIVFHRKSIVVNTPVSMTETQKGDNKQTREKDEFNIKHVVNTSKVDNPHIYNKNDIDNKHAVDDFEEMEESDDYSSFNNEIVITHNNHLNDHWLNDYMNYTDPRILSLYRLKYQEEHAKEYLTFRQEVKCLREEYDTEIARMLLEKLPKQSLPILPLSEIEIKKQAEHCIAIRNEVETTALEVMQKKLKALYDKYIDPKAQMALKLDKPLFQKLSLQNQSYLSKERPAIYSSSKYHVNVFESFDEPPSSKLSSHTSSPSFIELGRKKNVKKLSTPPINSTINNGGGFLLTTFEEAASQSVSFIENEAIKRFIEIPEVTQILRENKIMSQLLALMAKYQPPKGNCCNKLDTKQITANLKKMQNYLEEVTKKGLLENASILARLKDIFSIHRFLVNDNKEPKKMKDKMSIALHSAIITFEPFVIATPTQQKSYPPTNRLPSINPW